MNSISNRIICNNLKIQIPELIIFQNDLLIIGNLMCYKCLENRIYLIYKRWTCANIPSYSNSLNIEFHAWHENDTVVVFKRLYN